MRTRDLPSIIALSSIFIGLIAEVFATFLLGPGVDPDGRLG
ncbi:MAG: hypothetical protein AAGD01_08100 [Acidobacteriota bacterium]